jgi:hypothetical protein
MIQLNDAKKREIAEYMITEVNKYKLFRHKKRSITFYFYSRLTILWIIR